MGNALTPISACIHVLARYLRHHIRGLTVIEEWPYGNQQLEYPSVTITSTKPKRMSLMPEQIDLTEADANGMVTATFVVAEWDDTFQLDLWTRDKLQRDMFLAKILKAFSRQQNGIQGMRNGAPDGLSLPLKGYYENQYARFDIDSTQCVDDEASAQRQERREKITVLVNTREIRRQTYYAIKSNQIQVDVSTEDDEDLSLIETLLD